MERIFIFVSEVSHTQHTADGPLHTMYLTNMVLLVLGFKKLYNLES